MAPDKKSAQLVRQIDENLRRVYRQDENMEVPERFKELLEQLKSRDVQDEGRDPADE